MVSTRGGARTSATESNLTLKKKPVRKTTVKATTTAGTKAKATRSRKAEPPPEPDDAAMEDEIDELAEPAPVPVKTARRGRPKVKKDEEPATKTAAVKTAAVKTAAVKTAAVKTAAVKTASKSKTTATTRSTAEKTKKAEPADEDPTEVKATARKVPELKPAQTRATRPTRATAAKEKAAPLSPKKITQVTKAPKKKLEVSKVDATKTSTQGRPVLRKRGVSDENEGIPQLKPTGPTRQQTKPSSTKSEKSSATQNRKPANIVLEDEMDSTLSADVHNNDEAEMTMQEDDVDSEDELLADQESDDELCAPKTPMKRCDPREQSKYSPAKGTQLEDINMPNKTPVRRFQVLGTQQGTPQTQRPYCKPSVPMSEMRPMTVSRAHDNAMVFPKLQPLPPMKATGLSANRHPEPAVSSAAQMAGLAEHVHMESSEDFVEQDSDTSLLVDASISSVQMADIDCSTLDADEAIQEHDKHEGTVSHSGAIDPEANTVHEEVGDDQADAQGDSSLITVGNVLINPQGPDSAIEYDGDDETLEMSSTPKPETMVWANIREDVTIPFVFDGDASPARALPQAEPTERLSIISDIPSDFRSEVDVADSLQRGESTPGLEIAFVPDLSVPRQGDHSACDPEDEAVNVSDFVDVSTLAGLHDPNHGHAELAGEPNVDIVMVKNPTVEDLAEDEPILDGDVTLMCEELAASSPIISTPVKLTMVEDMTEEDVAIDGDMTLMMIEPPCPATIKRSPIKLATAEDIEEDSDDVGAEGDMTLDLKDLGCPRTIRHSPVKLSLAEDVPEETEEPVGDVTLVLDSPLPRQPRTPALVDDCSDSNVTPLDLEESGTPHYARSTFSSRRKSISDNSRPATSDDERGPLNTQPSGGAWFDAVAASPICTPRTSRSSSAHARRRSSRSRSRPRTLARDNGAASPSRTPKNHLCGLPAQQSCNEAVASLAYGASQNDISSNQPAVRERFPGMPSATSYQELLDSPSSKLSSGYAPVMKTPSPRAASLKRKTLHEDAAELPEAASPQQALPERFPSMPSRSTYQVQTAMPATRFRTPTRQSPIRRPATARKPTSLRKLALKAATTPLKTQAPAGSQTPGQVPMTPHPAAPLRGVVALVDVYTHDGACASQSFAILLKRLGAKTTKTFNENVTHVVFKEGAPKLLQAMTIRNKQVAATGEGKEIFCVNSRWVNDCDAQGRRMPEVDEEYAVDLDDCQRTAKRRRKSMEPLSLLKTNGGSVIRDRNGGAGRVSIGRKSTKASVFESPERSAFLETENKENDDEGSEPATPAYLKAPNLLIQQTVPAKRMHKLDLGSKAEKSRRLTFADGLEF